MTDPNDSVLGAAFGFYACLAIAYLLWLAGHYTARFHRAGVARLRALRARQGVQR